MARSEALIRAQNKYNCSEKRIDSKLKKYYGISLKEYNEIFNRQKGCCAICGKHQQDIKGKFHVDHKHDTGKVRGLLCVNCNILIGYAKEKPTILLNVVGYLLKWMKNK